MLCPLNYSAMGNTSGSNLPLLVLPLGVIGLLFIAGTAHVFCFGGGRKKEQKESPQSELQ